MPKRNNVAAYRKEKDTTDKADTVLLFRVKGKLWRRKENGYRSAEGGECKPSKELGSSYIPKATQNVREMVDDENFHLTGKGVVILNLDNDEKDDWSNIAIEHKSVNQSSDRLG